MAIIEGSQLKRNCDTCKKNKGDQEYYSCGYIDKEKRRKKPYDFPATKNNLITIDVCPMIYYNRYSYLYKWFNIERKNNTYLRNMTFGERVVYTEFENYLYLKQEYLLEKERSKNG